jgi:A/G-specific adenine glycosylase
MVPAPSPTQPPRPAPPRRDPRPASPRRDAAALLDWFAAARRDLPWRGPFPRDPYAVLVSEVMLQQTQVERVVPRYVAFLARFPTAAALAAAPIDAVRAAWTGLGYYRRAALLHAAARAVTARGGWPTNAVELGALPGLGAYTAAAVGAFAFGGAAPPVDGNVMRLAARRAALALPAGAPALRAAAAVFAGALFAARPTPATYEALMELGATVCTPAAPRCAGCPLSAGCRGQNGDPTRFPQPRPRRAPEQHRWVALWLVGDAGRVLLERQQGGPLLEGLWLPPIAALAPGADPATAATALLRAVAGRGPLVPLRPVAHSITHRRITVLTFAGRAPGAPRGRALALCDPTDPRVATSSLLAKLGARAAAAPAAPRAPRRSRCP